MDISIKHERFEGHEIIIRTAGFFSAPRILSDGNIVKGKRGNYILKDDTGNDVSIQIKSKWLDSVPKVRSETSAIATIFRLKWWTGSHNTCLRGRV